MGNKEDLAELLRSATDRAKEAKDLVGGHNSFQTEALQLERDKSVTLKEIAMGLSRIANKLDLIHDEAMDNNTNMKDQHEKLNQIFKQLR